MIVDREGASGEAVPSVPERCVGFDDVSEAMDIEEVASRVVVDLDELGARPRAAAEHDPVFVEVLINSLHFPILVPVPVHVPGEPPKDEWRHSPTLPRNRQREFLAGMKSLDEIVVVANALVERTHRGRGVVGREGLLLDAERFGGSGGGQEPHAGGAVGTRPSDGVKEVVTLAVVHDLGKLLDLIRLAGDQPPVRDEVIQIGFPQKRQRGVVWAVVQVEGRFVLAAVVVLATPPRRGPSLIGKVGQLGFEVEIGGENCSILAHGLATESLINLDIAARSRAIGTAEVVEAVEGQRARTGKTADT